MTSLQQLENFQKPVYMNAPDYTMHTLLELHTMQNEL